MCDSLDLYGDSLCESILNTAVQEATFARQLSSDLLYPLRNTKDRSDSESSHDSHNPMLEYDRSWLMALRRRSSNLSDLASRRSSDITSRRSSSSTRYSSDFSSEFEEYFESFQKAEHRRKHAAIQEESGAPVIHEFVHSMVTDLLKEGSTIASQMMPGVQQFGACHPPDLTRPTPVRPSSSSDSPALSQTAAISDVSGSESAVEEQSSSSSNQTDDEKMKENIVAYVENLLRNVFQSVTGQNQSDQMKESEAAALVADRILPGVTVPRHSHYSQDSEQFLSPRSHHQGASAAAMASDHYLGATAMATSHYPGHVTMTSGRPSTTTGYEALEAAFPELPTEPFSLLSHSDESLTDEMKQAVVQGHRVSLGDIHPIEIPLQEEGDTDSEEEVEVTLQPEPVKADLHTYAETIADSLLKEVRKQMRQKRRSTADAQKSNDAQSGDGEPSVTDDELTEKEMLSFAENLVKVSIQSAVGEVFGYKDIQVSFSSLARRGSRDSHTGDSHYPQSIVSDTFLLKRKSSLPVDDSLSSFAADLARRSSLDDINKTRRRSSGFRDSTLSSFADELIRSNPNSPSFAMFEHGLETSGRSDTKRRGSGSSRTSSSDRSTHGQSRRSSTEFWLFGNRSSGDGSKSSSSHGNTENGTLSSCKAVLLEFLSHTKPPEHTPSYNKRSLTSHLDWFAEDLLLDAFSDSFVSLYGSNYADLIQRIQYDKMSQDKHNTADTSSSDNSNNGEIKSEHIPKQNCGRVERLATKCVNRAMHDAVEIVTGRRRGGMLINETEDGDSQYEDAIDVPYPMVDSLANQLSHQIMDDVYRELRFKMHSPVILMDRERRRRRRKSKVLITHHNLL